MSSETSQSPPTQNRTRHLSKFVEGPPATGAELLQQTPTSNELRNILNEMDEFERKRQHRGSSSSVDSLVSPAGSPVKVRRQSSEKEGRSVGFGRPSQDIVRERVEEKKSHKIVGRLRAFTGGRQEAKISPYEGT